jgi:uncharacterized protein
MQMNDSRDIAAPPAVVWAALFNPEVLKACVPGCEELTGNAADGFEAAVVQKVGPVKARFTGLVKLSDIVEGQSCTISGEGKGGAAGFAKGAARVTLTPSEAGTLLAYEVDAQVGGKLAQMGSRIIDGFARKMAEEFFSRFQDAVEGPAEPETGGEAGPDTPPDGDAPKKGWFKRLIG